MVIILIVSWPPLKVAWGSLHTSCAVYWHWYKLHSLLSNPYSSVHVISIVQLYPSVIAYVHAVPPPPLCPHGRVGSGHEAMCMYVYSNSHTVMVVVSDAIVLCTECGALAALITGYYSS